MSKYNELVTRLKSGQEVYCNSQTGIATVHDGSTGLLYSCHPNISDTGSIRGMKNLGYWGKKDRCVRSSGYIYNIDMLVVSDELSEVAYKHCNCDTCRERKGKM